MRRAFTLIEVLIVIAILALLVLALTVSMSRQREKADDARIKSDLNRLKIAFEDYYNDNNCYPPATSFDGPEDCGSNTLSPYLATLPCDRKTNLPYPVEYSPSQCGGFRLYATLSNTSDPDSLALQSPGGSTLGNYGVSSTNLTVSVATEPSSPTPSPTPAPTPSPGGNYYWCSGIDNCSSYDPLSFSCSPSYTNDPNCGGVPGNKCQIVGSCTPL